MSNVEFNDKEIELAETEEGFKILDYKLDKIKDGKYFYHTTVEWNK